MGSIRQRYLIVRAGVAFHINQSLAFCLSVVLHLPREVRNTCIQEEIQWIYWSRGPTILFVYTVGGLVSPYIVFLEKQGCFVETFEGESVIANCDRELRRDRKWSNHSIRCEYLISYTHQAGYRTVDVDKSSVRSWGCPSSCGQNIENSAELPSLSIISWKPISHSHSLSRTRQMLRNNSHHLLNNSWIRIAPSYETVWVQCLTFIYLMMVQSEYWFEF